MSDNRRCVVIPAVKKNAVIPDQLVKRLAGVTLMQRAIDTAKELAPGDDIVVVTDSQEIALICERNGVRHVCNPALHLATLDIVRELRGVLEELARSYAHIVIYRASCPLLTSDDIEDAYATFVREKADCLVTVKSVRHRVWEKRNGGLDALLSQDETEPSIYVESKALVMLASSALAGGELRKVVPYFLNDRSIEINSYQDWWICEKLLMRKHIVFVVAGYPAIGMGHIFRALMLAHEVADHRITFLCTRESELAASNIAARDYRTKVQQDDDLAADVLALRPDLVVNDVLNTDATYVSTLRAAGVRVVNFEDEGPGAHHADLVVNALYEEKVDDPRFLHGHRFFCLRDEFVTGERNDFRDPVRNVLITFGGTDHSDFSRSTLDAIEPLCRERGITIRLVAGPGYAHKDAMQAHVERLGSPLVEFTYATNVMSRMMEGADLAICSAGRTVYELAHMRVPAIVMAHHEREGRHTFARARNGFAYLGVMEHFDGAKLTRVFSQLLDATNRRRLFERQARFEFIRNKADVVRRILALLDDTPAPENA